MIDDALGYVVVIGYAAGWAFAATAFFVLGLRLRSGRPRAVVPIALIGATIWPLFVIGVMQWAMLAGAVEIARWIRRRDSIRWNPVRIALSSPARTHHPDATRRSPHVRISPETHTVVAERSERILTGWGIWLGPVVIATARPNRPAHRSADPADAPIAMFSRRR